MRYLSVTVVLTILVLLLWSLAIHLSFALMNFASDFTFGGGIMFFAIVAFTAPYLIRTIWRKHREAIR